MHPRGPFWLVLWIVSAPWAAHGQSPDTALAGAARADTALESSLFSSVFDPLYSSREKSMGLFQSSLVDALDQTGAKLQVAWVIDGTTSMESAWKGLRRGLPRMIGDLRRRFGDQVSFALVIYRDQGAASGKVSVLTPDFASDPAAILQKIESVELESGAPYFLEPVDLGVRKALELPWDAAATTTRWLIVVGDAPPFGEGIEDPSLGAVREATNEVLIDLARSNSVTIHGFLCASDPDEFPVFQQMLDRTRRFQEALAAGTGGIVLDSSQHDVQAALRQQAEKLPAPVQPIGRITAEDVTAARASLAGQPRIRVAVLPHTQRLEEGFDPEQPSGRAALELHKKLARVPALELSSIRDVQEAIESYVRQRDTVGSWEETSQACASFLGVDYVFWGRVEDSGTPVSAVFQGHSGALVARAFSAPKADDLQLVSTMLAAGYQKPAAADPSEIGDEQLDYLLERMNESRDSLVPQIAVKKQTLAPVLSAYRRLEGATRFAVGDPLAEALLKSAEKSLGQALQGEPRNPWCHYLLANCLFNQAQMLDGSPGDGRQKLIDQMRHHLDLAYEFRHELTRPETPGAPSLLATAEIKQIEADYEVVVHGDYPRAVAIYQSLFDDEETCAAVRRSAAWMLMGLHAGDWGCPSRDLPLARHYSIQILARWPESSEAEFLQQVLRWRPERGTLYADLPLVNQFAANANANAAP